MKKIDFREMIMRLTGHVSLKFVQENGYSDITHGGLVIGRTHGEGGVLLLRSLNGGKSLKAVAEIQHAEFVMSPYATYLYEDRLNEINADKSSNNILTINDIRSLKRVHFTGDTSMVVISMATGPQYIINDKSTAKYINELEEMNNIAEEEYNKLIGKLDDKK